MAAQSIRPIRPIRPIRLLLPLLITLPFTVFAIVPSQAHQWIELGSAPARFSESSLTIVPNSDKSFAKLRFHISQGSIILHQARVYLVNGDVFHFGLQKTLKASTTESSGYEYSQMIPLVNAQQSPIKRVEVSYKFKMQQQASNPVVLKLQGIPVK